MTASARPRNLLVILTDDQGCWAMGCAGTPEIHTPNLDRLATEGIRFTSFFCTSPVCSPARASLLTGRIPSAHGVHDWLSAGNVAVDAGSAPTVRRDDRPIEYLQGMSGFTDVLADNGFYCAMSGKWHLGDSARAQKGYRFWCAHARGGGHYRHYQVFDNAPDWEMKTQYVTDFFTDRAIDFLHEHGHGPQPFCLSVNYTAPHSPWTREDHSGELFALYEDCDFPSLPNEPAHPWGGWNATPEARLETRKGYCAAVTGMDRCVGRLLDTLEARGLREETLVVFLSDNGFNLGHHGICGKGNGTFPMNMYEESVKVPCIVSCPGVVPAGVVHDGLWSHYDVRPTLLDLFGFSDPEAEALPGRSFASVLRDGRDDGREDVVVFDEYGPVRMIRSREWKYIHRYPYGPHELYHLQDDPGECCNRVEDPACDGVLADLRARLQDWFLRYADPALDGAKLPVTGRGQRNRVGPRGEWHDVFERPE